VTEYQEYSFVWLIDQNEALLNFLTYGKDLSPEEQNIQFKKDDDGNPLLIPSKPKLVDFKAKVHKIDIFILFSFNDMYLMNNLD